MAARVHGVIGIRMSRRVPLWMFLVTFTLAIVGFGLWGKSNLDSFDREYGLHAHEFYSKVRVLDLLNKDQVGEAKKILEEETESIGLAVATCLMNNCSSEAKKVRDEFKNL